MKPKNLIPEIMKLLPFVKSLNPEKKMKNVKAPDLRQLVYDLIEKYETVSELEVKNYLQHQQTSFSQSQVSEILAKIAEQDHLAIWKEGRSKVFGFGADSDEKEQIYLENNQQFCHIRLTLKNIFITTGKIGTDGTENKLVFHKNFYATEFYHQFLSRKLSDGYQTGQDLRIPVSLWESYKHLATLRPVACHIGYHHVLKTEINEELKTADYIFSWQLPDSQSDLKRVLETKIWSNQQFRYDAARLLEEKTIGYKATPASFPLLEIDNLGIFQISLSFENGEETTFYKRQMSLQEEMLPLVKKLMIETQSSIA